MPGIVDRDGEAESRIPLEDLLEELLMALLGYTGDVFVDSSSGGVEDMIQHPAHCTVQIAPEITWIGKEDREQLNELICTGFHCKQLQRFIQQEQQYIGNRSLYRQAMCEGLTEVLAVYEDEVVRLQLLMRQQGTARGVPGIMYELADFQMLLPQLHQLIYDLRQTPEPISSINSAQPALLEDTTAFADGLRFVPHAAVLSCEGLVAPRGPRGSKLLAILHAHRLNGQPLLQACLQRLLWHVNQVVFNQLTMWMVHGMLADEGCEFFIRRREPLDSAADKEQPQDGAIRCSSDNGRQHAALATRVTGHMLQRTERDTYQEWHEAFEVAMLELPPYITPNLAASVEFVGRAVRLLRAPPASAKLHDSNTSSSSSQQWVSHASQHQQLLPHEDTLAFASALRELQQQPVVSQAALERTVEAIRASVAGRLWELLVVQAGLMQHLNAIKDYLLLARGDFFQCFLADAARLLASPPREATATNDLAVPWLSSAAKSTANDDPYFKIFKLVLRPKPKKQQLQHHQGRAKDSATATADSGATIGLKTLTVPSYDHNWDELALEVQLPWPLGVLLTPKHMEKYNKVFQLLLRLKRVQLALEQAWQELGRLCGRSGGGTRTSDIMPLLLLRQHMGHLIGNLQIYLQLDVVDSNFAQLQAKVAQAQDFHEAEHAHEQFLHALVTQSFLGHQSLVVLFGEVFSHTTGLCRLVRGAREQGIDWEQVQMVTHAFDNTVSQLYVALRSKTLQQFDKAPYLRQLYQRLDFNDYLESQKMRMVKVSQAARAQQLQQQQQQATM